MTEFLEELKCAVLNGAGEHISFKGFKGVVGNKQKNMLHSDVKTTSENGALVNWGRLNNGENWAVDLKAGKLFLDMGVIPYCRKYLFE